MEIEPISTNEMMPPLVRESLSLPQRRTAHATWPKRNPRWGRVLWKPKIYINTTVSEPDALRAPRGSSALQLGYAPRAISVPADALMDFAPSRIAWY